MSRLTIVCLHGFTQNGTLLERHLAPLRERLPADVEFLYPDGPHACAPQSVAHLAAAFGMRDTPPGPHRSWWNATDDGAVYRGWETTLEHLRTLCERPGRVGVLGFSQGAIAAAALAAMHEHDRFPPLSFAVLIAGRTPRAADLAPLFRTPLLLPSLHVWGERDAGAVAASPALAEAFSSSTREVVTWGGPHSVPGRGPALDAIVDWVTSYA